MKITFTPLVAYRLICRAKRNFLKSKANDRWKSICKDLPVLFYLNNKSNINYYGMAIFNNQRDIKFFNEIDEPMVTVGKQQGWLVIELNASIVTIGSPMSNFKLVTHEFAHCLDFVLRGKMMPNNKCHDQFFQDLNNFMGGGDIDYVNVNGHKNKVAKTLDSFNGPYHIMPSFFDVYSDKLA